MLCPESTQFQNEGIQKEDEIISKKKNKKVPTEGSGSLELNSFKIPKNWKKSISNFFRSQLRSTKSNDGDRPLGSRKETYEDKGITSEQKWQSLGKVFRRQSFGESWHHKSPGQGESSQNRLGVRKVLSSYFGKTPKFHSVENQN